MFLDFFERVCFGCALKTYRFAIARALRAFFRVSHLVEMIMVTQVLACLTNIEIVN